MLNKIIVSFLLLLLTSCNIDVVEIGTYWNKASLDPELTGKWVRDVCFKGDIGFKECGKAVLKEEWNFIDKDGSLFVETHIKGYPDKEPYFPIRTLAIGNYRFYIAAPPKDAEQNDNVWEMGRYSIADGHIYGYLLNEKTTIAFIAKSFPNTKGIIYNNQSFKIKLLDDETASILSNIPDTSEYWEPVMKLDKVE